MRDEVKTYTEAAEAVQCTDDWNTADYFADDELAGLEREQPPFGTERHRFLSTIRALKARRT